MIRTSDILEASQRISLSAIWRIPVFAYKGESIPEYWQFVMKAMIWPDGKGPDQIVDDGGDATGLIHMGVKGELDPSFLKTAPKSIIEIYYEATRRDARMRQFLDRAREAGARLIEADSVRIAKLAEEAGC